MLTKRERDALYAVRWLLLMDFMQRDKALVDTINIGDGRRLRMRKHDDDHTKVTIEILEG